MYKVYQFYKKLVHLLVSILETAAILCMITMVCLISYQVFMRYVLNNTPGWTEELSIVLMGWFVFMGLVVALKENLHISIEMVVSRLPQKVAFVIETINSLLILLLSGIFVYFGFTLAWALRNNVLPGTGLSVAVQRIPVGIAGVFMILVVLLKLAEQFIEKREEKGEETV